MKESLSMKYWSDGLPSTDLFDDSQASCKDTTQMDYFSDGLPAIDLYLPSETPGGVKDFMKFF